MEMSMEIGILLAYAFGILVLYIIGYLFLVPIRMLFRLIVNSVLGGLLIIAVNLIGSFWDFHIPLNILSAICVGILGVPGVVLLYILSHFF